MFWRSTGLDLSIRKNAVSTPSGRDRRHLACRGHSPGELAALERSLYRASISAWRPARATKH
jgi:hypothetical protein